MGAGRNLGEAAQDPSDLQRRPALAASTATMPCEVTPGLCFTWLSNFPVQLGVLVRAFV